MEKTLHHIYEMTATVDQREAFSMVHEYPLGGIPPMMTHIFENKTGTRIIAAKGAPEAILQRCALSDAEKRQIQIRIESLANQGYRMLGVAKVMAHDGPFPAEQQSFLFHFMGLVVFYDPPKPGIEDVFNKFYEAGIEVKIITGDNPITTKAIATKAGIKQADSTIDGEALMQLDEAAFTNATREKTLFTRMFPEAKLAVINAFKTR